MFAARSGGSEEDVPIEQLGKPKKRLLPYGLDFKFGNSFKTTSHPDVVENALISYLNEQQI